MILLNQPKEGRNRSKHSSYPAVNSQPYLKLCDLPSMMFVSKPASTCCNLRRDTFHLCYPYVPMYRTVMPIHSRKLCMRGTQPKVQLNTPKTQPSALWVLMHDGMGCHSHEYLLDILPQSVLSLMCCGLRLLGVCTFTSALFRPKSLTHECILKSLQDDTWLMGIELVAYFSEFQSWLV